MITKQKPRPRCKHCKLALAKQNGKSKHGFILWHKYCSDCAKALYNDKHKYLLNKKTTCEQCDFIAQDMCQLDLFYKDTDNQNKHSSNLLTLCANCSRLHRKQLKSEKKSILNVTVDSSDFRI
jgi:hypothetical protein